jgi:hypothetical protein
MAVIDSNTRCIGCCRGGRDGAYLPRNYQDDAVHEGPRNWYHVRTVADRGRSESRPDRHQDCVRLSERVEGGSVERGQHSISARRR